MASSSSTPIERYGLTEVFTCEHPVADVVFVHGLNGDPERTWTSQATGKFWPRDFLPNDLDGKARILVYGYDADVVAWGSNGGVGKDMIHNHSERLVATLVANRRRQHAEERPLIFVAHSLGGLIVKRALVYSSEIQVGARTERLRSVYLSTYGILFLGTPHHGSDVAVWGSYLERLAGTVLPKRFMDTSNQLVDALKSNSETLINIDRQFSAIMSRFHIYLFHESKKTDIKGTLVYIVSEESAAPTLPDVERSSIPADHSHMCKFDSERSAGYDIVMDAISFYVEDAENNHTVAVRWTQEKQRRRIESGHLTEGYGTPQPEISEPSSRGSSPAGSSIKLLPSGETSYVKLPQLLEGAPPEPFFFVPPGFRPNSCFVGMKKQLTELDDHLFDRSSRQRGTAAVLLHGPPGCGKSYLAREYIYKHKAKFKGGIFWINARYFDELCKDLWQVAQKFVAKDSPSIRIEPSGNGKEFIAAVREWFNSRTDWLIVLDGISVDNRNQVEQLQKLIPDSKDSSLIYTSRSSQFHASQRLLHPRPIRVPKLSEKEGQDLIFKELNVKRTKSNEKAAVELVKKVGGLPLAIHAISVRLAETHEPLERYSPRSYADDPRIGVPYHEILQGLYNDHREAYNLMNILAFFGPHIPVELVMLGLKAVYSRHIEVRTRATPYEAADINTSFSVLMRHALVDRNEPDDTESAASSRSSLLEPEPIDILRLHTVVQKFCRDRLNGNPQEDIAQWVGLAVRVLQQSYREANHRMDERGSEHPPRVSDFREYLVHAERMKEHALEYEQKHPQLRDLRTEIEKMIDNINNEIHEREPSSSQESVIRNYAVSIFDRTGSSSSSDEPPVTPGYRPLHMPQDQIFPYQDVQHSPTEYKAIEMLRNLSNNTVRSEQVIVDDHEVAKEPQHVRTGSRPGFSQGYFIPAIPAYARPELYSDHVEGAMATTPMNREGNMSGSSKAVSGLTELYRNSPPPARGGGFISSRKSTPPAAKDAVFMPPDALGRSPRPNFTRTLTQRRAAEPQLTRDRFTPNPLAQEFVPSSWPKYTTAPTWGNWQDWNAVGQLGSPPAVQNLQPQDPAYWQARTSLPNASIDANLHATSGQTVLLAPTPHHVRASSVPDIPYHQNSSMQFNEHAFQNNNNLPSSAMGYSPANMTRDPSSNSHSSGSGVTAFRPPSIQQFTSPSIPPNHPLAQVASTSPPNSSPHAFVPRSSPLQSMQTPEQIQSTGSISPVTIGQIYTHPSPPPLGTNGQPVFITSTHNTVQSAPATTMFPPPADSPTALTNYRATSPLPPSMAFNASPYAVAAPSMSRTSSGTGSGPGIAIASPSYGLGIAEFPSGGSDSQPIIRFGQQDPVDVAEAQRRTELHRRYLDRERHNLIEAQREAQRQAQRRAAMLRGAQPGQPFGVQSDILPSGTWSVPVSQDMNYSMTGMSSGVAVPTLAGPAPYPPVNMMPSVSDGQVLQAMMEQNVALKQGLAQAQSQVQAFVQGGAPSQQQVQQQRQGEQTGFEQEGGRARGRGLSEPAKEGWPVISGRQR